LIEEICKGRSSSPLRCCCVKMWRGESVRRRENGKK